MEFIRSCDGACALGARWPLRAQTSNSPAAKMEVITGGESAIQRDQRVFKGMRSELVRDVHVGGALQHLRVDDISNNGVIFALKVLVE
jgi:hypothetical protein